jgi:cystathionine beta-lyase/cystathionine gamma-synthase
MIRGLRTLPTRLDRITITTHTLLAFLEQHPLVEEVIFPLHPAFPQFQLAQRQMTGACGLLTVVVKAISRAQIVCFCEALRHILMAVSWGGHESLVIPRCASLQSGDFDAANRDHRMLRFYFGLEEPAYLIADIEQAFAAMAAAG